MRNKILKFVKIFLLLLSSIIFSASGYLRYRFSSTNFEEVIFYLKNGVAASDKSIFVQSAHFCLPFVIFFFVLLYVLFFGVNILHKKNIPGFFKKRHGLVISILLFFSVFFLFESVNFLGYLGYTFTSSKFIEENYVDPRGVDITFDEKRNLIFIIVESMETSLFNKNDGGYWNYDVIPELSSLLDEEDTVYFYNQDKSQLLNMIHGASWSTASIFANASGLVFKVRIERNSYHSSSFMAGSYALGDVLKDNGYYNELISGARTSFGGVYEFYKKHGDYEIIDVNSLDSYNLDIKESDYNTWGFSDNYLFETAKKRLDIISKKNQPFNLNLITIDTHFVDGLVGDYSETKFDSQYENAYATTSRLIYDFIKWLRKQPYYDNTTVLIVGDHLSMQDDFFDSRGVGDRYVYSCIVNPRDMSGNFSNRIYSALDTYPTILYSIGANIPGNQLGLGVNLFSNEKTLAEKYGLKYIDKELNKGSKFYNDYIMENKIF